MLWNAFSTDFLTILCVNKFCLFIYSADNFRLDVGITTDGDLLLRLNLIVEIHEPLSLVLRFTDAESVDIRMKTIEDDSFMNTDVINHKVPRTELPFPVFMVQVAMRVGGVVGDFTPESQILSKFLKGITACR